MNFGTHSRDRENDRKQALVRSFVPRSTVSTRRFTGTPTNVSLFAHASVAPRKHLIVTASLSQHTNQVVAAFCNNHDQYGLVVDARHTSGRNDHEFEDPKAKHRVNSVRGFRRLTTWVESNTTTLQVNRIGRNVGDGYLVSQSETTASRFVLPNAVGPA